MMMVEYPTNRENVEEIEKRDIALAELYENYGRLSMPEAFEQFNAIIAMSGGEWR